MDSGQEPVDKHNSNSLESKKQPRFKMNRRSFLKLSALAGAAVAIGNYFRRPAVSAADSTPKETPLEEKWLATSCLNCSSRCATQVRVVNGKAVRITGNPLSRVSEGEVCPRAHIGLQVLYDEARIKSPLKRSNPEKGRGVDPKWTPVSWEQALNEVSARLKSLRDKAQPHQLVIFRGLNTNSAEDLIRRFADAYGTLNVISGDALDSESEKSGEWLADGNYTASAYDLEKTNYILAFGANLLESQKPVARNLRMWGKIRRERPNRAKIVVIDPRYSITAAKADQWLPINPGTDAALALAIANVIISEGLYDKAFVEKWTAGFNEYRELALSAYQPEAVAAITGIGAEVIRQLAREFAQTKPAIAWRGRGATNWASGSYTSYAIFCLNALVGSIDVPGGVIYQEYPGYRAMPDIVEDNIAVGSKNMKIDGRLESQFPPGEVVTHQAANAIITGKPYAVEMAMGFSSNFSMSALGPPARAEALKKVPYYVHIAPFVSEMAELADIILPSATFLEEWAYDHCPPGSGFAELKIKQPVVKPLYDTKGVVDIVLELAKRVGGTVARSFTGIGENAEQFVRYRTESIIPWAEFKEKGVKVGPAYEYYKYDSIFKTPSKKFEFRSGNLEAHFLTQVGPPAADKIAYLPHYEKPAFIGGEAKYPLTLSRYQPLLAMENGSQNYPWAQQMFLVAHGRGWDNFVEINSRTAYELGVKDGDTVWVESQFGKLKVKARVIAGIHPKVVAIAYGQGHYARGKWQQGIGVNPNEIIGVDYDQLSGQSAFFSTRVKVYRA